MARKPRKQAGNNLSHDPFQAQIAISKQHYDAGERKAAANTAQQVLAQNPLHPAANSIMGCVLMHEMRHGEAVEHWLTVLKANRHDAAARFNYATCLWKVKDYQEAVKEFNLGFKSLRAKKSQLPAQTLSTFCLTLSYAYNALGMDAEEEKAVQRALRLDPLNAKAHQRLGFVMEMFGRSDEALASYRRALEIEPGLSPENRAQAHRVLAFAKRHTKIDDDVKAMLLQYEESSSRGAERYELAFGLGKVYEELGEYKKAFAYWAEANKEVRRAYPYNVKNDVSLSRAMEGIFTRDYINAESSSTATEITPVFIVGMPRSGSSLVENIFAQHSAVLAGGELTFTRDIWYGAVENFPHQLAELKQSDWQRLGLEYLDQVTERTGTASYITDKYLNNYLLLGPLCMALPTAKIVHCQRDPQDTALSCFKNIFSPGTVDYSYHLGDMGRIYSAYERLMNYWQQILPERIYNISYEALTEDPEAEIPKLLEYVGLPFENDCLEPHKARRSTRTLSLTQVRQPIYKTSVQAWKNFEAEFAPFIKARKTPLLQKLFGG